MPPAARERSRKKGTSGHLRAQSGILPLAPAFPVAGNAFFNQWRRANGEQRPGNLIRGGLKRKGRGGKRVRMVGAAGGVHGRIKEMPGKAGKMDAKTQEEADNASNAAATASDMVGKI